MSRSIHIAYRCGHDDGPWTRIDVPDSHNLMGGQRGSTAFWGLPRIKEIGIERLAQLGVTDPIMFFGWDDLKILEREIELLRQHLDSIDYPPPSKIEWLNNLDFCYRLLIEKAPKDSYPMFEVG